MIYTVTFNPALDYVVRLEELALGGLNRAASESIQCGGKGINVSLVLRALGVDSVALGFVAGFTGQALETWLMERGVTTRFIRLTEGLSRINVKLKMAEETEINGRGPEIGSQDLERLMACFDRTGPGDIVVLAGSVPDSIPEDVYEQIITRYGGRDISFVVDTAGSALARVLPHGPFLIKPNHIELAELMGRPLETREDIVRAARTLQERGATNILVSLAGDGALLVTEHGETHYQAAARGQVRNSVGAGDSMVAGFLAGWLETGDYTAALRMGTAAGGATAFSDALADRPSVEKLLEALENE